MMSKLPVVTRDTTLDDAARAIAQEPIGWVPVVARRGEPVRREDVLGMLGRADVAGGRPAADEHAVEPAGNLAGRLAALAMDELYLQAVATDVRGVYLVGGAVRDLLLGESSFDIDLAVEGDGIAFARTLAARLKGHVRPHDKFGTAVVVASGRTRQGRALRVDVASTRSESYDYPAALPKVEHADIRSDLARRDFTINAMAVSLKPESFGALLDFFGGVGDLEARRVVVLHNLSFIEDPTRTCEPCATRAATGCAWTSTRSTWRSPAAPWT